MVERFVFVGWMWILTEKCVNYIVCIVYCYYYYYDYDHDHYDHTISTVIKHVEFFVYPGFFQRQVEVIFQSTLADTNGLLERESILVFRG